LTIFLRYAFFALVATILNLLGQLLVHSHWSGRYGWWAGVLFGTGVGFVVKFLLDRRYIFAYRQAGFARNTTVLILYGFTGVLTTAVFWLTEYLFARAFAFSGAAYLGAAIGLSIGYVIKYQLDKKYVFI
jgi:putative flippase GtrA